MKLNQSTQIEMFGDLISPQFAFGLSAQTAVRVKLVLESGVVVERVQCRAAIMDLATPVMSVEFHNQTHRMPQFQFSEN